MIRDDNKRAGRTHFLWLLLMIFFASCVSHLSDAKLYFVKGQEFSRSYSTEKAIASYKKSLEEARKEVAKHPSSQAFMLKGLVELNLNQWEEAEQSFLAAFSYGFEKGQEWAEWISLFGLASSLQEMGLEGSAFQIYEHLIDKSKLRPITILSAQKYADVMLQKALQEEEKERKRFLSGLLRIVEKLSQLDLSCGYYHYLLSQVLSHQGEYRECFEEAVMAKELGLPSEEILRDNDLQIVFCFEKLKEELPPIQWESFQILYQKWVQRWSWPDPKIPSWKKR